MLQRGSEGGNVLLGLLKTTLCGRLSVLKTEETGNTWVVSCWVHRRHEREREAMQEVNVAFSVLKTEERGNTGGRVLFSVLKTRERGGGYTRGRPLCWVYWRQQTGEIQWIVGFLCVLKTGERGSAGGHVLLCLLRTGGNGAGLAELM